MSRDAKPADVGYQRGKCGDATAKDDSRGVDGRASNAGATEPVASAVGAEGYPREARAGKRRGCARGGDEESRARARDAGSFSARTLRGWTVVVLIFAAHGPRGGRARPNSATSSRLNAKNTISYLYRAEGNRRRPTLTTDTQETRSFLELLFDEPVRGARALKRPSSRPRSASSDSHFVYSEERQNSTFHDDLLRSFTCRDATPRLEGAHGLVAPSSSFVASSRQGERAAVAQDAQSDQAEASPCDASPLLNHTDTGSCPPLSGVRPFCGTNASGAS